MNYTIDSKEAPKSYDYREILRQNAGTRFQIIMFLLLSYSTFISNYDLHSLTIGINQHDFRCNPNTTIMTNTSNDSCNCECIFNNCKKYIFEKYYLTNSLVSQFGLVCDKKNDARVLMTLHFSGQIVGNLLGCLGDIIGRKPFILVCTIWETTINMCLTLDTGKIGHFILRFLRGFSLFIYIQCLSLLMEVTPNPQRRSYIGNAFWVFSSLGTVSAGVVHLIYNDWLTAKYVGLAGALVYFFYFVVIPESPLWLVNKRRFSAAIKELKWIGRLNNFKEVVDMPVMKDETEVNLVSETENIKIKEEKLMDLLCSPNARKKVLVCCFMQASVAFTYFGLAIQPSYFNINPMYSVIIQGLSELPAYVLAPILNKYAGRKITVIGILCVGSLLMPIVPMVEIKNLRTAMALIVKILIRIAFSATDVMTQENIPTSVRSSCLTITNMCAIILLPLTPWIKVLADKYLDNKVLTSLPQFIFSIINIIGIILVGFLLPETSKCPLPETIEQSEKLARGNEHL